MPTRQSITTRNACMQARLNLIDAAATPGKFLFMSGGQPDPSSSVSSIPAHAVSTAYVTGDYVTAGLHYYRAENDGTSAGTAPTWPTDGGTVVDNDITWQDMGETPKLLGTLTLSQPCATLVDGEATFNTITEDPAADDNGECTFVRLVDGDDNLVIDLPVGDLASSAPVKVNTTTFVQGGPIRVTSAVLIEGGI